MIARVEAGNKRTRTCDLQEMWPQQTTLPSIWMVYLRRHNYTLNMSFILLTSATNFFKRIYYFIQAKRDDKVWPKRSPIQSPTEQGKYVLISLNFKRKQKQIDAYDQTS